VTATTAERAFIVETMGRDAGWLVAATAFGGAEIVLVPEIRDHLKNLLREEDKASGNDDRKANLNQRIDAEIMRRLIKRVIHFYGKNRNVLIGSSEGFTLPETQPDKWSDYETLTREIFGTRKKVGVSELLAQIVQRFAQPFFKALGRPANRVNAVGDALGEDMKKYGLELKELKELAKGIVLGGPPYKFEMRPHRTDYLPRSGEPSPYDYRLASVLGTRVGHMLATNPPQFSHIPCLSSVVSYDKLKPSEVKLVQISTIKNLGFRMNEFFDVDSLTVNDRFVRFLKCILTGPPQHELINSIHETDKMLAHWRRANLGC